MLFKITEEAIPFNKFAPEELKAARITDREEFRKTFLPSFSKIVCKSFAVVVLPLVPVTKIVFVLEFLISSAVKLGFNFRAICPGQVDPCPRFRNWLNFEKSFPNKIIRKFIYIDLRTFMRSSIGGWVSKSEVNHCFVSFPLNGLTINKCAVALLADLSVRGSLFNFSNALARPSG